jgi:hypothetical protein
LTSRTLLAMQVEINEKMRGILIDWLVEVHLKFKVGEGGWVQTPQRALHSRRSRLGGGGTGSTITFADT